MYSELHLTGTRQFLRPSIHHPRDDSRIQIDNRSPTPAQLEFGHLSLPAIPHPSALAVLAVFAPIRGGKQIRYTQSGEGAYAVYPRCLRAPGEGRGLQFQTI